MTDPDILEKLQVLTGVGNINGPYITKGNYDLYQWNVTKQQDAAALLMMIYSFMGYRRQVKIKELLEIWKSWTYRNQRDCINGHLRTKDSYYIDSKGRGSCNICRQEAGKKYRLRKSLGY